MRQVIIPLLVAVVVFLLHLGSAEPSVYATSCGSGSNKTHNYFYGRRSYYDRLLYYDHIQFKSKWMQVIDIDKEYPGNRTFALGVISYIQILDGRHDGSGGCVYIKKGGIGSRNVTIHFKTQRNHGMEFNLSIYGQ